MPPSERLPIWTRGRPSGFRTRGAGRRAGDFGVTWAGGFDGFGNAIGSVVEGGDTLFMAKEAAV